MACTESGPSPSTPPRPAAPPPPGQTVQSQGEPQLLSPPVAPEPKPPPKSEPVFDPGRANLNPDDDEIVGPPPAIEDCEDRLRQLGVKSRAGRLPEKKLPNGVTCGTPQAIVYLSGPTGIRWNASPQVSCQMALGLARFEQIVAEEAGRELPSPVTRIRQGGTYSCRKMARFLLVSEHSYGNAIDVYSFGLKSGKVVSVKAHFGSLKGEPQTPEARFLRNVARRAFAEDVFSVVLTPFWDRLHADHFHLDQARYRVDASGPISSPED